MKRPLLKLIYGLPGAGKSTFLARRCRKNLKWDSFMANAIMGSSFPHSRHFVDIITALREGKSCAIVDIRLCEHYFRREVQAFVEELVPKVRLKWYCFDCTTEKAQKQCLINLDTREAMYGHNENGSRGYVRSFGKVFTIEPGAEVMPIFDTRVLGLIDNRQQV